MTDTRLQRHVHNHTHTRKENYVNRMICKPYHAEKEGCQCGFRDVQLVFSVRVNVSWESFQNSPLKLSSAMNSPHSLNPP